MQSWLGFSTNAQVSVVCAVFPQLTEHGFPIAVPCRAASSFASSKAAVSPERMHLMEQQSVRVRAVAVFENFRKVTLNIGSKIGRV